MTILYYTHSGLRYVILAIAAAALIGLARSVATGRSARRALGLASVFAGLLDLQIVLGIVLVIGGIFPDAVVGHLVLMVLAALVTHAAAIIGQRTSNERRDAGIRLGGIALAVALILGGIMAIGRSVLGSAPPPVGYSYNAALPGHIAQVGFMSDSHA